MAQTTQPVPIKSAPGITPAEEPQLGPSGVGQSQSSIALAAVRSSAAADDGTSQLLKSGGWTLAAGVFFALLAKTVLGGIGPQGPHTNSGWMALIVTMMCLPFGFLVFALGVLKWLRNRRVQKL